MGCIQKVMQNSPNKMQIRAEIIRRLEKYKNADNVSNENISNDINELEKLEDKKSVAKVLFKEVATGHSKEVANVCAIMAIQMIDNNTFEDCAINILQDKNIPDKRKFFVISLIKQKGIFFDYDEIENYVENPEQISQNGIEEFLQDTLYDPEAQIDLLDFYLNIPKNEREYVLETLIKDKETDAAAYTTSLLIQIIEDNDELELVLKILSETKSPYAISAIEYILDTDKIDLKTRQKLKHKLKLLKDSFNDFRNDKIIENSKINDSYISFIDGNSNFSLVLSRISDKETIDTVLITINTACGITSCMGFGNLSMQSYTTIKKRLFGDSVPIIINPMALKKIYSYYKTKNKKTNTMFPYELIVWENLMSDIKEINYDISNYLNSKLDSINLTEDKIDNFLSSKITESWYWTYGQNKEIDLLINQIESEHITDYKNIDNLVCKTIDEKLLNNNSFIDEIKDRLLISAYIAKLAKLKMSSCVAYSLCFKNPYFKKFITYMIDKSIYSYLADIYEENATNNEQYIFKREIKSSYSNKELDKLMSEIEAKWT